MDKTLALRERNASHLLKLSTNRRKFVTRYDQSAEFDELRDSRPEFEKGNDEDKQAATHRRQLLTAAVQYAIAQMQAESLRVSDAFSALKSETKELMALFD